MRACGSCGADLSGTHFNRRFCNPRCRYAVYAPTARSATRAWRKSNPERARDLDYSKHLLKKYGITVEQYNELLSGQNGRCAICCRTPEEVGDRTAWRLAVDHCHVTGRLRGLLCRPCNTGIGQLQESIYVMENAIQYMRKSSDD